MRHLCVLDADPYLQLLKRKEPNATGNERICRACHGQIGCGSLARLLYCGSNLSPLGLFNCSQSKIGTSLASCKKAIAWKVCAFLHNYICKDANRQALHEKQRPREWRKEWRLWMSPMHNMDAFPRNILRRVHERGHGNITCSLILFSLARAVVFPTHTHTQNTSIIDLHSTDTYEADSKKEWYL